MLLRSYCFGLKILVLFYVISCSSQLAAAEQVTIKRDSTKVYKNIETFSKKSKFTRFMYSLIFKPDRSNSKKMKPPKIAHFSYADFEGKIVRNIRVTTLNPFGYSVTDTSKKPDNFFLKTGNEFHIKSQKLTIKNVVLIRKNKPFDSLLVKESERLIRHQRYVRDVLLYVVPAEDSPDSIDVYIRVLDKWSFVPDVAVSSSRITVGFTENNFAGLGHEANNVFAMNHSNGKKAFSTTYSIPNIRNTFINTNLHYSFDENDNFTKSLTLDRPFYSPLAQWAAGLNVAQQFNNDTVSDTIPGYVKQNIEYNTLDFWGGIENNIFKGNTEDARTTNGIVSARYLRIRYLEKPDALHDSLHQYADEDFYLSGIGISTRKYVRDHYIYNFGVTEDVPVGKVYGITAGYQLRNAVGRLYLGMRISNGSYNEWGYLSSTLEYGTFFHGHSLEQGVLTAGTNYFSNLFSIGNWQIRQFVKPQLTWGINMAPYDSLTINDSNGIKGFSSSLRGTKKIVLTLQTQSYAPWDVLGFRFGPYLICSVGMLGNEKSGFSKSPLYSQLGVGTLVKNEYLVFNNFQFSIAYYPPILGNGYLIKFNSIITTNLGFRDFVFGKPAATAFQ